MTQKKRSKIWLWLTALALLVITTPVSANGGNLSSFTLSVNTSYNNYVKVEWPAVAGATHYEIQRWGEYVDYVGKSMSSDKPIIYDYMFEGPYNNGRYCYLVIALNDANETVAVSDVPCVHIYAAMLLNNSPGLNGNRLTWTPTNGLETAYYRIGRWARNGSSAFNTLTYFNVPAAITSYLDQEELSIGQEYCYQVQAMTSASQILKQSNTHCIPVGQVDLWLPNIVVTPDQSEVFVPINLRNAGSLRLGNADIWLDYDASFLTPLAVLAAPLTEENYIFQANLQRSGQIRIATLSGSAPPIYGSGTLFWIKFQVHGELWQETSLTLTPFVAGIGGTILGNQQAEVIPTRLVSGRLQIGYNHSYMLGDINGDNVVNTFDAALALEYANLNPTPFDDRFFAADVNGNGVIDSGDATMILYYAAYQTWPKLNVTSARARLAIAPTIGLSQAKGGPGQLVPIQLTARNLANVAGGQLIVTYDPTFIQTIDHVEMTDLARTFGLDYQFEAGRLKISMAGNKTISGNGNLATIWVKIADDAPVGKSSPLYLSQVSLNDLAGRDFATSALQQPISRTAGQLTISKLAIYLPLLVR